MKCQTVTILNRLGLHARASAKFVQAASSFKCEVTLMRESRRVNGKSIMGILMLAAAKGTIIEICTDGEEEEVALASLVGLVEGCFGEND